METGTIQAKYFFAQPQQTPFNLKTVWSVLFIKHDRVDCAPYKAVQAEKSSATTKQSTHAS